MEACRCDERTPKGALVNADTGRKTSPKHDREILISGTNFTQVCKYRFVRRLQSFNNDEFNVHFHALHNKNFIIFLYPQSPAVTVNKEIFKEYICRSLA